MGFLNKLFGKKEANNYTEKLATIILEEFWTKDSAQAIDLADALILNMGHIKAEEYILGESRKYGHTTAKVFETIKSFSEGKKDSPMDAYYAVGSFLVNGADDLMQRLINEIDDLTKLTFTWGDVKSIFIDEIKLQYPNFNDITYDDMSEKLMEYLCFNIQVKNGKK